jgi:hypothetical protein
MFQQSDSGPFWLSDQEKDEKRLDKVVPWKTKKEG